MLAMVTDANLLLRTFKGCHHATCENFEVEIAAMSTFFEKFITRFSESKVSFFVSFDAYAFLYELIMKPG